MLRFWVGAVTLWVARARPCTREDFRYDFSECHEGPSGAGPVREAFAYAVNCNPSAPNSSLLPQPLLDLPCEQPCESNHYLQVKENFASGKLKVSCLPCPRGQFSLGGGLYVDGSNGDWSRPWPKGLKTSCLYRSSDARWVLGGGASLTCVLHVNSLVLETRAATWNQQLQDQVLDVPLKILSGDACESISQNFTGSAVLVLRGDCPFTTKAQHLKDAGAKAVIVYNNLYQRPHFYPAATNGTVPSTPMFMVTREDGERIIDERDSGSLTLHVASTRCSLDRREVAPSANESSGGSSWQESSDKSCSEWSADPSGAFLHSGDNHGSHWLFSFLTLSTRFVRDGYIRFRYAVDAEDGYDGLLFEMDGNLVWNRTVSQEAPWRDFQLQVPRGSHSFTWTYQKDFSTSSGEDRARLELLEVSGTAHADSECRSCSLLSIPGSKRCLSCSRNSYAEIDSAGEIRCSECPNGTWAPAASVGRDSCKTRRPCSPQDVQVMYRLPRNISGSRPKSFCYNNKTTIKAMWRLPKTCQSDMGPKELAGFHGGPFQLHPCPPCQPNQWRPSGGACVQRQSAACSPPLYAVPILDVKYWHMWPKNVTSWIWGRSDLQIHPHAWQRAIDGGAAVVGSAYLGEEMDTYSDQALLTFDVDLTTSGEVTFALEEEPIGAWGQGGALYVDHEPREAELLDRSGARSRWNLKLSPGWHWVTWVWRYKGPQPEEQAADAGTSVAAGSGLRLLNVTVTNVRGAPANSCRRCPPNHGWRKHGATDLCEPCPVGTEEITGRCKACADGYANPRSASRCVKCGPGTTSDGRACKMKRDLQDGHLTWDARRFLKTWSNKTLDAGGFTRIVVEDRTYYLNLLQAMQLPGASREFRQHVAFVWEALAPRSDAASCPTESSFVRPVVDLLEAVKANEGKPPGLWFNFQGRCFSDGREASERRLHLLLSCHPDADPFQDFSLLSAMEPPDSLEGCQDVALEWRTKLACPVCQEGDWEAVAPSQCDPVRGQRVTYIAPSDCFGGAEPPDDHWEPCPGVLNLIALVIVGALVGCILCCLSIYVLLLRRRYAKYMTLDEGNTGNSVAPSSIGVPDSPGNFA